MTPFSLMHSSLQVPYKFSTFNPLRGGFILKIEYHAASRMVEVTWGHKGRKCQRKEREKRDWQRKIEKKCLRGGESDKVVFKMDASSRSKPQRKREKVTTILLNYTSPSGQRSLCLTIEFRRVGRGFIIRLESVQSHPLFLSYSFVSLFSLFLIQTLVL